MWEDDENLCINLSKNNVESRIFDGEISSKKSFVLDLNAVILWSNLETLWGFTVLFPLICDLETTNRENLYVRRIQ